MADLDRLLTADISHAAEDGVQPPDFAPIEHRGTQRRRTHTLLMAAAAAVVIALVAAGGSLVLGYESTSPPASPGTPSPTFGSMPTGDGAKDEAIEPGTYRIPSSKWSAVDFTIAFPKGWTVQYGHIYHSEPDAALTVEAAVIGEIFTDACRGEGVRKDDRPLFGEPDGPARADHPGRLPGDPDRPQGPQDSRPGVLPSRR